MNEFVHYSCYHCLFIVYVLIKCIPSFINLHAVRHLLTDSLRQVKERLGNSRLEDFPDSSYCRVFFGSITLVQRALYEALNPEGFLRSGT